jgi:hypothetical protein
MISEEESLFASDPSNFAYKLTLQSLKDHLSDLQQQLVQEKTLREKEIIELRLKGLMAKDGTIPLSVLGHLARNFSDGLYAASQLVKSGKEVKGRIAPELMKTLDLRLAGIGVGSTKLYITGNNAPDLFGHSLLEESLQNTFSLLNAESGEQLTNVASQIGRRGLHRINAFLKTLASADLEAEIKWSSPTNEAFEWEGTQQRILAITNTLDSLTVAQPEVIQVQGILIMLSMRGSFEIRSTEGATYRGKLPLQLLDQTRQVHIGDDVSVELERKIIINELTGFEKAYYTLVSIS